MVKKASSAQKKNICALSSALYYVSFPLSEPKFLALLQNSSKLFLGLKKALWRSHLFHQEIGLIELTLKVFANKINS